jgi:transposase
MEKQALFGKNIIITDNTDWTTGHIIETSLDRWQVEDRFRLKKDDDLFCVQPIRHGTDSKIRCHRLFAYLNFGGCFWSLSGPDF